MNTTPLLLLLSRFIALIVITTSINVAHSTENEQNDRRYLAIQPVVTRNDDGEEPAPMRLYKAEIAKVYKQAGIEIVWLPHVFLDSSATRDGRISPDAIVNLGKKRGHWGNGVPRINLIFVKGINGKSGPRGLGMTPGPICFVALPDEVKKPEIEAFCIIHEMGHCLGLIHAVDDPRIDNGVPSIMGGGAFAERIGDSALHPLHVVRIRASRLILRQNYRSGSAKRSQ